MFIRSKKIKGKEYAYLVKNRWTKKGARQKVSRYLGRVCRNEQSEDISFFDFLDMTEDEAEDYMARKKPVEVVDDLVSWALSLYGFEDDGSGNPAKDCIMVDMKKKKIFSGKKEAVLFLGSDYMCSFTLKRIYNFKSSGDRDAVAVELAGAFIGAGIPIPKPVFVWIFQKIYKSGQSYMF